MEFIKSISYDWHQDSEYGEVYQHREVGKNYGPIGMVVEIIEHRPAGEGDRWFYDIVFDSGKTIRTFNPNQVEYLNVKL